MTKKKKVLRFQSVYQRSRQPGVGWRRSGTERLHDPAVMSEDREFGPRKSQVKTVESQETGLPWLCRPLRDDEKSSWAFAAKLDDTGGEQGPWWIYRIDPDGGALRAHSSWREERRRSLWS